MGRPTNRTTNLHFEHRLALVNWMLDIFGAASFEDLAKNMRDPAFEEFAEDGISKFHHCLKLLFDRPELPHDLLLAYDGNIVRHWKAITARRNADGQTLYPKYFQYLCLLFAEIYLDRYFRDPDKLLADLNAYVARFNAADTLQQRVYGQLFASGLPEEAQIAPYAMDDLKKLAFWSATGSGKTLLMHINILQYQHYLKLHGRENQLNRIILLTPNEGLSRQHLDEFKLSGFENVGLFEKDAPTLFSKEGIDIIDIHKLKETSGEKTVAIEAFEGRNLVLVDEGHRGTSGAEFGHWMKMRSQLCEKGISFEYSRSNRIVGLQAPKDIERLETLNVFGIHADYMKQFKEYLEDEGLPTNENRFECVLPVVKNLGQKKLKAIRLKDGIDFKRQAPKPTLRPPNMEEIKKIIESGQLRSVEFQGVSSIMFGQHLYQPLVYVNNDLVEVKPVPLNDGEKDFVLDLQKFCAETKDFFKGKELYLLRNMTRGRGIGFFEAGNFYPDFILWLLAEGRQYINFVDPKGLLNIKGEDDPKIAFYKTIKTVEGDLRAQAPSVTLNSFIISNTRLPEASWWGGGMTKADFEKRHVLFQREDRDSYVGQLLTMAVKPSPGVGHA